MWASLFSKIYRDRKVGVKKLLIRSIPNANRFANDMITKAIIDYLNLLPETVDLSHLSPPP